MSELDRGNLEQNLIPEYCFEWNDGTERTTAELPPIPEGIEVLAEIGKEDNDCEVTLTGYST